VFVSLLSYLLGEKVEDLLTEGLVHITLHEGDVAFAQQSLTVQVKAHLEVVVTREKDDKLVNLYFNKGWKGSGCYSF